MCYQIDCKAKTNDEGVLNILSVLPTFVPENGTLGQTDNEFNGVLLGSALADEQFFYGKGAGRYPTSSAVLSDISAYKYGYKYEYKKGLVDFNFDLDGSSKFYIGFNKAIPFDQNLFESIDEQFINKERVYMTGHIQHSSLYSSGILSMQDISVISYN